MRLRLLPIITAIAGTRVLTQHDILYHILLLPIAISQLTTE